VHGLKVVSYLLKEREMGVAEARTRRQTTRGMCKPVIEVKEGTLTWRALERTGEMGDEVTGTRETDTLGLLVDDGTFISRLGRLGSGRTRKWLVQIWGWHQNTIGTNAQLVPGNHWY
jgi:hypothetical protein